MSSTLARAVRIAAAVVVLGTAWVDGLGLESYALAKACCAHRQDCGGSVRAPDKCCERMGHSGPARTGIAAHSPFVLGIAPTHTVAPILSVATAWISTTTDTARLHDPPHLHTFALLI